jgi:predicted 3-demethylubiquinone-9 3-methyltransferase (glyoxalase superfamily)
VSKITPFLWFDTGAGEAARFYASVFKEASILNSSKMENTPSGTVEIINIKLLDQEFTLMSAGPYFKINEAISFVISTDSQEETDYYWSKLSADVASEQCGWLKDKFGVSWQVIPKRLGELMGDPDPVKAARVQQAMLKMKKIEISELEKAYAGQN